MATEQLDIGRVFTDAFGALQQNLLTYTMLSLLFVVLPASAVVFGLQQLVSRGFIASATPLGTFEISYLRSFLVSICYFALQGALMSGMMASFDGGGRRLSFGQCLHAGLMNWPPLLGLGLVRGLAVLAGTVLFIVPGIILNMAWFVSSPARMLERQPLLASLTRSAELTRGHRWPIFGVSFILGILGFVIGVAVGFLVGFIAGVLKSTGVVALPAQLVAIPLVYMITYPLGAAVVVSVYRQLRGPSAEGEGLAAVFS
jgi:hypothetical protein